MRAGVLLALALLALAWTSQAHAAGDLRLRSLSNRADLVSGGDVLVEVRLPKGASAKRLSVRAGRRNVSAAFKRSGKRRVAGLVTGLRAGRTVLRARLDASRRGARLAITNHPIGGPVFAGEQVEPWVCGTEAAGLGAPTDEQCNAPAKLEFFYRSTAAPGLRPYDPENPPADVAQTTTDDGESVPYVIRRERGTMDRGIYDVAVLYDPEREAPEFNGKVLWPFGGGTAPSHVQGTPEDILQSGGEAAQPAGAAHAEQALASGWLVATSGLNIHGNNANDTVSAEAVMMLQEHIAERYGAIRFAIGEGCSGGGLQQYMIAASYPGLLDGLIPQCSFPDLWTSINEVTDCNLLLRYFDEVSPAMWLNPVARAAVAGTQTVGTCNAWVDVFGFDRALDPTTAQDPVVGCDLPPETVYDPQTNPDGTRCTIQDYQQATWGLRPQDGFARRPVDNTGIQYGLRALRDGAISAEQFVDLNEKVGGFDIDYLPQPQRHTSDPGTLRTAYRAGLVTSGRSLARVPIIDLRGTSNNEVHTDNQSYRVQARLQKANGTADNMAIFTASTPLVVPQSVSDEAFTLMDEWLTAIEADRARGTLPAKVLRNRPDGAVDSCYPLQDKVTDPEQCAAALPHFANPRIVAGAPQADDVMKCRLAPLDRSSYGVDLTDAHFARLQAAFPVGVCDFSRPGVGQQHRQLTWISFAAGPGGRPLGRAPRSRPLRRR